MITIKELLNHIALSRQQYIHTLTEVNEQQAQWKPTPQTWNAVEITEHLFWAEQGGILGMWKTLLGIREGSISYEQSSLNDGLSIEEIIQRTWQQKEIVPPVAAPRLGGPLSFWLSALGGLQPILETFGQVLTDADLAQKAHPHPISGSMTFGQRLAFLRFHIDRHRLQAERLLSDSDKASKAEA